ncbi:hypothetical protein [Levyella massiliensis]|uniref:hypothetical protein n=1 Tax=Levyella massiliensis TaxID=938289 RepID=UPI00399C0EB6
MGKLSSRECATIIWGVILIIYVITKKETRNASYNVIKIFFGKKLRILWIVYFLYVVGITSLFSKLSLWKNVYLKDVIIWTLFSGLINYMNAVSREADENYIIKLIKENLKLIIIFEFIMSTFTFNILVELLIIPIFTLISILSFVSERDAKYKNVYKLTNSVSGILGFVFLYKTIEVGVNEYQQLNVRDTLISFLIPIIYLVLTLPLIYIISLYSKYELLFLRMSFKEGNDKKVNKKRRFDVLRICNISVKKVRIFTYEFLPRMYKGITDEEFDNLLNEFKYKL